MIFRSLAECLRGLYGNDAIDRLEAAPAFEAELAPIADLIVERDADEQARFDDECARELAGDLDE